MGSTASYAGFEGYGCGWGPPVLAPVPRTNDTWGMGWQNLYDLEVAEMLAADLTQACLMATSHCWKHCLSDQLFCKSAHPKQRQVARVHASSDREHAHGQVNCNATFINCALPQRRRMSLLLCTVCTRMCRRAVHLQLKDWKVLRLDQDWIRIGSGLEGLEAGAQAGSGISHAPHWLCCYQVATARQELDISHPG